MLCARSSLFGIALRGLLLFVLTMIDDIKNFERERRELGILIKDGYEFQIDVDEVEIEKRLFGLMRKRKIVKRKKTFRIEEPTLGTLDRMSAEWINLAIDESKMKSDSSLNYAQSTVYKHNKRCAKIVAIAVIGSEYEIPVASKFGAIRYKQDLERLERLTELFMRTIKPSDLYNIIVMISVVSNIADFVNSIRLMSAERTTAPDLIEDKED